MRKRWLWLSAPAFIVAVALWWGYGLQGWLSIQTGTAYCGNKIPGAPQYCYHSGFGSVYPFVFLGFAGIVTVALTHWRAHTCHYAWWCWRRPNHPLEGNEHILVCSHHHPGRTPLRPRDAVEQLRHKIHARTGSA
jgi:hypothetical protein